MRASVRARALVRATSARARVSAAGTHMLTRALTCVGRQVFPAHIAEALLAGRKVAPERREVRSAPRARGRFLPARRPVGRDRVGRGPGVSEAEVEAVGGESAGLCSRTCLGSALASSAGKPEPNPVVEAGSWLPGVRATGRGMAGARARRASRRRDPARSSLAP